MKQSKIAIAVAALFACFSAHAIDAFDGSNGLLTLESVTTGGVTYKNVAVQVTAYADLSVGGGAPVADSFDGATNYLTMGAVMTGGVTYNNVRVRIDGYSVLSAAGAPTAGTQAVANYPANSEVAGYLVTLNNYRTQCGLPALSQNAVLDSVAIKVGADGNTVQHNAAAAGYSMSDTVGGVNGAYNSNSTSNALVGKYIAQIHMSDPFALLSLMRPYSEVGLSKRDGNAGFYTQRSVQIMLGNPLSRGLHEPVTFPCANTTDVAPSQSYINSGQGISYAANPLITRTGYQTTNGAAWGSNTGTPIAVMANPGDTLTLTDATVTRQGGAAVAVVLQDHVSPKQGTFAGQFPTFYSYEASVTPRSPLEASAPYDVVIHGLMNGKGFTKSFTFRTGAEIPVKLP